MNPYTHLASAAAAALLLRGTALAGACPASQTKVIDAEVRCVEQGGMNIGFIGKEGAKVACMQNKQVQGRCGPDGAVTRLNAYRTWFAKLKAFEAQCLTSGGTFAYQDPLFIEPQNESFCLQAQPEIRSSMFEEPLCNYRSLCPAVTVICDYGCEGSRLFVAEEISNEKTAQALPRYHPVTGQRLP